MLSLQVASTINLQLQPQYAWQAIKMAFVKSIRICLMLMNEHVKPTKHAKYKDELINKVS